MPEKTIELEISVLVQGLQDDRDACLAHLEKMLAQRKGILRAHIKRDQEPARLCLHYDPNLISLAAVEETAAQVGAEFAQRFYHERIAFAGMDAADAADTLNRILKKLPGMLHSQVNYAAGLAFVAYDSTILDRASIEQTIRRQGARIVPPLSREVVLEDHSEEEDHDHGSAPAFLPHWMQERWTLLLVSLAGVFFLTGWVGESFLGFPENIALIFFLLSYLAGGYDIATHALPGLFKGYFDTDVLMLAAAAGAALLGEWAEGAFLLFLFSLGHAGEHYALDRARNAVNALGALMPKVAQVKRGEQIVEERVDQLEIGEVVVVRPGDRIPVDGEILHGASAIDQSAITGESVPVEKGEGEEVFAGTINHEASLDIRVTKLSKDNTLSRVLQMVTEAQSQQSPTQQFTQRFTARFVPAVLILVALVVLVPPVFGWMALQDSFYRGMLLLVAASPCALAIGTPASVLAGIAQAARNGVLIKGGMHLENLGGVSVMAFDKTGTLTEGTFRVTDIVTLNGYSEEEILQTAAAVEQHSNHPLALALVNTAYRRGLPLPKANGLENLTGRGVRSEIDGKEILIGSLKLFETVQGHFIQPEVVETIEKLENTGRTTMAISQSGEFLGVIALADTPRKNVKDALKRLLELGVQKLVMLTGDNEDVAQQIASEVGVTDVRADLLPEEKLAAIQQMQEEFGGVAMIGDGVNDAPALATATVGIAMGGAGTAVALETADVALMADDIGKLPYAVGLSRASRKNIRQNLMVSLGVIGLLLITSVFGLVQLSWAVVLHEGSTIIVVLNALRLLRYQQV
ncbi:MAG: cadmium-translocating P-type ATPase [Chloroflexi bacterium]|nr:MAG: cadmium-translocating P-type ATPase [Chloroflexota bacterium]MBL1197382.1 cadmium-translocating P-type ATPase [Chloroflexota bacterium]NOH14678.1 cadmium-translocating P-type ATPase [Chloroflexota bacterium]